MRLDVFRHPFPERGVLRALHERYLGNEVLSRYRLVRLPIHDSVLCALEPIHLPNRFNGERLRLRLRIPSQDSVLVRVVLDDLHRRKDRVVPGSPLLTTLQVTRVRVLE